MPTELHYLSAVELAKQIRARPALAVEAVEALAERIKSLNPKLNAYYTLDLENARKEAEHKAKLLKEHPGRDLGALYGVPVAVKDDLAVKGLRYAIGSRLCAAQVAEYDDVTVQRLRKAGAVIVGKTHEPEFGHKGTTDNLLGPGGSRLVTVTPWDLTRTSGGSSGGSGAAVAAGLAYLALGTDIGGSVRIPASFCGIVAHKPTFGMIPRVPSGNAFTLWSSGPLARDVADTALAMRVLSGQDHADRFSLPGPAPRFDLAGELPKVKVVWCAIPTGVEGDPEVVGAALGAVEGLARGGKVTLVKAPQPLLPLHEAEELKKHLYVAFGTGALGECLELAKLPGLKGYVAASALMSKTFRDFVTPAWEFTLKDYVIAHAAITTFCEDKAARFFGDADLIATPTLAVTAFDKDLDYGPDMVNGKKIDPHLGWCCTWPFNLTGEPAVSLPCGWTKRGDLPIGLQLVGRRGQDALVLRVAAEVEKLVPPRRPKL